MSVHYCRIMVCQLLMLQLFFFSIKASVCIAHGDPPAVPTIMLSQLKIFVPDGKPLKKKKKKLKGNAE